MKNYNSQEICNWILNDEGLYNLARSFKRRMSCEKAAIAMLEDLKESEITTTPNGIPYTKTSLKNAMRNL